MPTQRSRSRSPAQLSHFKATALLARLFLPPTLLPKPAPTSEEQLVHQQRLWADVRTCEEENELLLSELRRAVEELDTPLKPTSAQTPEQTRLALLEQDIAHLEAAIDFYSTDPPPALDPLFKPSPSCVQNDVSASLARTVVELEKALKWETARAEKERREVARERTLCEDAKALEGALRKRVEEGSEELSAEEVIARAQRKAARVNGSFGELMRSLVAFIDEWIAGDLEEEKAVMHIRRFYKPVGEEGEEEDKALVLKQLLENLMNAALVESPLDPYLDISDIPRDLVDFLVGAGVVQEHPGNGRKVRLVDFGRRMGE